MSNFDIVSNMPEIILECEGNDFGVTCKNYKHNVRVESDKFRVFVSIGCGSALQNMTLDNDEFDALCEIFTKIKESRND